MADAKTRVEDKQDKPGETFNVINEWGTYVSTYTHKKKNYGGKFVQEKIKFYLIISAV